jgi:hypothetical protein
VVPKQRYLHLPKTKNGDARDVPLSTAALKLLGLLPKEGPLFLVAAAAHRPNISKRSNGQFRWIFEERGRLLRFSRCCLPLGVF